MDSTKQFKSSLLSDEEKGASWSKTDSGSHSRSNPQAPPPFLSRTVLLRALAVIILLLLTYNTLFSQDPAIWPAEITDAKSVLNSIVVQTSSARYRGIRSLDVDNLLSFLAIPYAQPPVGDLRFRAPKALSGKTSFENITDVKIPNDGCPRPHPWNATAYSGAEDCLTLSVTIPRKVIPDVKLPVLVWIHGGGFYIGAGDEGQYDPQALMNRAILMNKPFIFVSINYRLGTLGFSASPPKPGPPPTPPHIPIQAPEDMDLNIGFKDQLMALEWVQREIEYFGGDKTKVTLFGHSAGAISIGLHQLYSPRDLFRGAFMLSGAPTSFPVPGPDEAAIRTIHSLPGSSRCPPPVCQGQTGGPPSNKLLVNCLRKLPLQELMHASQSALTDYGFVNAYFPFYPVLEGEFNGSWLHTRPSEMISSGNYAKIPMISGNTVDEGTLFAAEENVSKENVTDAIQGMFTFAFEAIETILTPIWDYYPDDPTVGSPYQTGEELFKLDKAYKRAASVIGDFLFQAPRRYFLSEAAKDPVQKSWSFIYDDRAAGYETRMGVTHAVDLRMWFYHPDSTNQMQQLSRHMSSYLINFVSHLDPNGPGLNTWSQYGTNQTILHLARNSIATKIDKFRSEAIHFINRNNEIFSR